MNESENILRQYMQAMSSHNVEKIRTLLHPQYTYTGSDGKRMEGVEAGIAVATMYMNAFPDMQLEVKNILGMGDIAIAEFIGRGTHKGEIMDIAPTGRQIAIPVCDVVEVRDGKIFAEREYFDAVTMRQQLGA